LYKKGLKVTVFEPWIFEEFGRKTFAPKIWRNQMLKTVVVISSMLAEEFLVVPGDLKSNEANLVLQRVPTIFGKKEVNVFFFALNC
jgi:hypothetical protein